MSLKEKEGWEVAKQGRAHGVLAEDQSLAPITHAGWIILTSTPSSRDFNTLFWLLWTPAPHMFSHMCLFGSLLHIQKV